LWQQGSTDSVTNHVIFPAIFIVTKKKQMITSSSQYTPIAMGRMTLRRGAPASPVAWHGVV
jgi:hypothetical protein